jgi:hypothetical protein
MVQAVTPAAPIASVSSAGTSRCACSYGSILSARTRVCIRGRGQQFVGCALVQQRVPARLVPDHVFLAGRDRRAASTAVRRLEAAEGVEPRRHAQRHHPPPAAESLVAVDGLDPRSQKT